MKPWLTLALIVLVSGCMSMDVSEMSATQLRATNGMVMCAQVTTLYGRASTLAVNADDVRKGAASKGKTELRCGEATMLIEHEVGVAK